MFREGAGLWHVVDGLLPTFGEEIELERGADRAGSLPAQVYKVGSNSL